ncbi:hypothetical protein VTN31DRAFT_4606 [Thermomyces dupontii]|uniref:uncharacterized protein n=1 Tax=Talaromyces thermophilus TaxID=28565 RepID=UPI00374207F6
MGWVAGVATLVFAIIFVLPRRPHRMWNRPFLTWFKTHQTKAEAFPPGNLPARAETEVDAQDRVSDSESAQTTPKASATTPSDQNVPTLNPDESHVTSEPTSTETSKPPITPSPLNPSRDSSLMPPPPRPTTQQQQQQQRHPPKPVSQSSQGSFLAPPKPNSGPSLRPPPSSASSLRVPPRSKPTSSTLAPAARNSSRKVVLEPGHSPLDWAALTSNPRVNLRGANLPPHLIRVTPSMLKAHNGRKGMDAWTSFNGKVYNITPYLPFHPGGKGELLRGAGKDCGKLFMEIHPWVNFDGILGECLVGILVSEHDENAPNDLDKLD